MLSVTSFCRCGGRVGRRGLDHCVTGTQDRRESQTMSVWGWASGAHGRLCGEYVTVSAGLCKAGSLVYDPQERADDHVEPLAKKGLRSAILVDA